MVIIEQYLKSDGFHLRIGGVVTRDVAHFHGVPHGTALIANIILKNMNNQLIPHILLHWRDKWKKTCPEMWDICGGHLEATNEIMSNTDSWENDKNIKDLFNDTARREANEEFCIIANPKFEFKDENIKCFGGLGSFKYGFDNSNIVNKEYSTFYLAFVPQEILIVQEDDKLEKIIGVEDSIGISGKEYEAEASKLRLVTLPELLLNYIKKPNDFADGISRILTRLKDEPGTLKELNKILDSFYK